MNSTVRTSHAPDDLVERGQPPAGCVRPRLPRSRLQACAASVLVLMLLSACTVRSLTPAPVVDRGSSARAGAENAGKPGFYTVKPGDTLIRIGLDTGQNWSDISRWNGIDNPNLIEVGQVLRVAPPASELSPRPVLARPVPSQPPVSTSLPPQDTARAPAASTAPAQPASPASSAPSGDEDLAWMWPVPGTPIASFDEIKNKGIGIAGRAGEPVLAAADGRVVYAGSGLRGYGNLVILKHNNTFLTAYAHNQALVVKEDQAVRRGQKIAEMGSSDADRVKLHFEIRRQGKPVDPLKYLPPR